MKKFVVVAYDVVNDHNREKVAGLLGSYGVRVNRSVFECIVTLRQLNLIRKKVVVLLNPQTDTLVIYPMCVNCRIKREVVGIDYAIAPSVIVV